MSDIKSSLDKIKNIPKEPVIYHTKGAFFEKIGKIDNAIKIIRKLEKLQKKYL